MLLPPPLLPALHFYQIDYSADPPLLTGRNDRPLTAEEITETCELLLAAATQQACPYWLLDGRSHQQAQPQALHDWMLEEFFPRAQARLGRVVCVAFLVPPFVLAGLPSLGYQEPHNWLTPSARMGWFSEVPSAQAWLAQQRARQD
jgi:hypothetical protein